MADRFPLIVNSVSKKIEELVSGDNLDLTGNGIIVSGDTGSGKYLTSDGTTVFWGNPGDVYLTQTQTLTNKTIESGVISGALNTLTDIPNSALVNSGITVNNITIPLGGSVVTPDNNTTYVVSAQDGLSASEKIIRLTSAGNAGAGINDDVILAVGVPTTVPSGSNTVSLFLDRVGDKVTVSGHVVDNNTITTISAPGGTNTSGAIDFTSTGAATVSMTGSTVNIDALDTDTRTKIRAGSGGSYGPADTQQGLFTFLDGTGTVVAQGVDGNGDPTITYTSSDTVTQVRGGSTGTYTPAVTGTSTTQISFEGGSALGGNTQVTQNGNTILIDSTDTNTVTKVGSDNNGSPIAPQAGDFIFKQSGATTITQSTNGSGQVEITVSSINSDTGAILTASNGIILDTSDFKLKNASNLSGNRITKWDNGNAQLADSIISDDGSTVTIAGDLQVDGSQTILNTSVLQVEDNIIELRKGTSIVGADGGIQVNRTTDANDVVTSYKQLQWHESGGYWRSWDGSVEQRLVTEIETQVLTNKTLTSPTLTSPILGAATATSINGLEIASTASAVLDVQSGKTVDINNDLTFTSDNNTGNTNVNFRVGGDVAFKSDTLASFASTTATQLRTLISGTTGVDDLVFQTNPVILTGLTTTSTGFALINSGAQSIQFGGAATAIDIGNTSGTTNISGDLVVEKDLTVGGANTDLFTCNARIDVANSDILIRGGTSDPMTVGRGNSAISTNTAVGKQALLSAISGSQNSAVGYESLLTINAGAGNTGLGHQVLRSTGVGNANTAVGRGSMLSNLSGDNNVALGANSLETNTTGSSNVCIGFYAGYNAAGSGNVLIGPADSGNPVNDATYSPLNPSGDRQLVIGSGTEYWVRGDSNFDVTISNDLTVNTDLTVKGDLVVNGVTTTIKSNTLEVSDKSIELAKVVSTQFTCTTADGSANISSISPTLGLIPGMVVTSNTGGVSVPNNTTIVSLSGNTAVLSNNVTGTGTPTFSAIGPSDTAADGGGLILDGTTDHTFTWSNANDAWQSSENMELANGKVYYITNASGNPLQVLSETLVGPNSGVAALGSAVTTSSLTSVGTLTSLAVSGNTNVGGTPPWTVTGGNFRSLSISGSDNASSGFLYLGNGSATTNADFDLGRINFLNATNITAQIAGSTQTSADDDGRLSFHTKPTGGTLTERFRITSDGTVEKRFDNTTVQAAFPGTGQVNGISSLPSMVGTPFVVAKDTGSGRSATFAGMTEHQSAVTIRGYVGIGADSYDDGAGTSYVFPTPTGIQNNVKLLQIDGGDGAELILGNSLSPNVQFNHVGAIAFKNIDNSQTVAPNYAGIRCNCTDTSGNMNLKFYGGSTDFEADTPHMVIGPTGKISIGTTEDHDRDLVVNTGGSSSVYFGMTGTNANFPWVSSTKPILSVGTDGTGWPSDASTHSHKLINFGIGGGTAGTSAAIEHSHFAIQLNGTILSEHGIQSGGNATGGYKLTSQYSGKGYDIATQYATAANGGSGGTDPMFSGWWGATNTLRINTNGMVIAHGGINTQTGTLYNPTGAGNKVNSISQTLVGSGFFQGGFVSKNHAYEEYAFRWGGITSTNTFKITGPSYFMCDIEYRCNQSNSSNAGDSIHRVTKGVFANNYIEHTWTQEYQTGNCWAINNGGVFTATNTAGGSGDTNQQNGMLKIVETYSGSGSYQQSTIVIKVYYCSGNIGIDLTQT